MLINSFTGRDVDTVVKCQRSEPDNATQTKQPANHRKQTLDNAKQRANQFPYEKQTLDEVTQTKQPANR